MKCKVSTGNKAWKQQDVVVNDVRVWNHLKGTQHFASGFSFPLCLPFMAQQLFRSLLGLLHVCVQNIP